MISQIISRDSPFCCSNMEFAAGAFRAPLFITAGMAGYNVSPEQECASALWHSVPAVLLPVYRAGEPPRLLRCATSWNSKCFGLWRDCVYSNRMPSLL